MGLKKVLGLNLEPRLIVAVLLIVLGIFFLCFFIFILGYVLGFREGVIVTEEYSRQTFGLIIPT